MKLKKTTKGDTLVEVMFAVGIFGAIAIGAIALMNKGVNTSQTTLETTMARQEIDTQSEALRFIHDAYVAESESIVTDYSDTWKSITERAYTETSIKNEIADFFTKENTGQSCSELFSKLPTKSFVINSRNLGLNNNSELVGDIIVANDKLQLATTYPRMLYGRGEINAGNLSDTTVDETGTTQSISDDYLYAAEGIWVTNIASDAGGNDKHGDFQPDFYDFHIQTCWNQAGSEESSTISSIVRLYNPDRVSRDDPDSIHSFTLYYDANEGSGAPSAQEVKNITIARHTFNISTIEPTRSNFVFLGWSTNQNSISASYGHKTTSQSRTITTTTRRATLYAVWQKLYNFSLSYDANGGANAPATEQYGPTTDTNHIFSISATKPTRTGYRFLGWSTSKTASSAQYASGGTIKITSESATLYAVWQKLYNFSLSYDANGGADAPAAQISGDVTTTSHTFTIGSSVPTRANYRFLGWSTSSSDTSAKFASGDKITVTTGSTTLYAIWKRTYTIILSYDANGGSNAPASETFGPSDSSSHKFTISSTAPTRTGYRFLGWSTSASASTASYGGGNQINLITNTTLYAVWQINKYACAKRYALQNADGSYPGYTTESTEQVNYGATCSYSKSADGYQAKSTSGTMTASGLTLDLQLPRNTYTLTVNSNTSYISSVSGAGTYRWGQSVSISATASSGNEFTGWSVTGGSTGSFGSTASASTTYTMPMGNSTIYANGKSSTITFDQAYASAGKSKLNGYYKLQDMSSSICSAVTPEQTSTLIDTRDNQTYTVAKWYMDFTHTASSAKCWMTKNLNLGAQTLTVSQLNSTNTHITNGSTIPTGTFNGWKKTVPSSSYTDPEFIPISGSDSYGNPYGTLYNYAAASAGSYAYAYGAGVSNAASDLCPAGWRMPTGGGSGELKQLITNGYSIVSSAAGSTKLQQTLKFPLAGYFLYGAPSGQGSFGNYWSSTMIDSISMYVLGFSSMDAYPANNYSRNIGLSIKCISN